MIAFMFWSVHALLSCTCQSSVLVADEPGDL